MRKTFLLLCASLFLGTQAQNLKPVLIVGQDSENSSLNALPKAYSADGKDHLLLLSPYEKKITVFNDDLGVQSEIDLSPYFGEQFATCAITKYRDTILVATPELNYQEIYDISYSNPMDSVNVSSLPGLLRQVYDRLYNYLDKSYVTIREVGRTEDAVSFKVGLNDKFKGENETYFSSKFYMGNITCALKNGKLTIGVFMSGYSLSATGEWKERRVYNMYSWEGVRGAFVRPDIETLSAHDTRYLIASQTLFNSDKNYEYLVYTFGERQIRTSYERDQDNDGEIDYIRQTEAPAPNGFQIVQDNGNVLASVKIEDGYKLSGVDIYEINGKYYLCAGLEKVGSAYYEYFERFYAFEKGNATSLQAIRTERVGIKASPAVARRNEMVSIDLSGVKDARAITLTNSNGQTLKQQSLEQGQRTAVVNTNGLSAGMYIVNVTDGSHTTETCKIIIR